MNKKILIILASLLGLLLIIALVVYFFTRTKTYKLDEAPQIQQTKTGMGYQRDVRIDYQNATVVNFGDFTANMNMDGKSGKFIRVAISGQVSDPDTAELLLERNILVRDAILSALSLNEFSRIASPEGKERLKNKMMNNLNRLSGRGQVQELYFTEFQITH